MLRDFGQNAFENFLVEALHVFSLEWWLQSDHLIDDTTQTPHITFDIIRLIFPDFRGGVVRSPRLRIIEPISPSNFTHIHISKLSRHIIIQKNIRRFQVPMHNLDFVHRIQPSDCLDEYLPDLTFFDIRFVFFVLANLLKDVSVVGQFHDDAI